MLAEIKETSEEKSIEDNIRQCIAPGEKQNTIPHQEFKYSALDIHKDLYQLMKFSVAQSGSPEQTDKAMKIWTTFVEPMLGVSSQSSCIVDLDGAKTSNHGATSGSTVGRNDGKVAKNGDEVVLTKSSCSSRASMLDDKNGVKENGFSQTNEHILIPNASISTDNYVKIERGTTTELSPNGNFKRDNFAAYRDLDVESAHKSQDIMMNRNNYQYKHQQSGLENETCVDENAFENGDDSVSESADAEDLSLEYHDNKGESEGVADGMGDDICPISEHFLKRVKPLMLHVPATLHHKEKNSRVFYGNDDFYVFFRLHQVKLTVLCCRLLKLYS